MFRRRPLKLRLRWNDPSQTCLIVIPSGNTCLGLLLMKLLKIKRDCKRQIQESLSIFLVWAINKSEKLSRNVLEVL